MLDDRVYQILTPSGDVAGRVPDLSPATLLDLYRWMVAGRIFSDRMVALQRQGRMGTFAPLNGQEATCVAMAAPLEEKDWLLGSYRESFPYIVKGVPLLSQMKHWGGHLPADYPYEARCIPFQIVLATQVLHAVGIAMAIDYKKEKQVVMVGCGDGATSEGDFNEALNFAGVFKPPVIFLVQNNGWAISVPRKIQSAVETLADRGRGFGVPGRIVDGNDILAVYQVVSEAIARARAGQGATLIEAITYRLGAHTTADDPTKYQPPEELEAWRAKDPIPRYRKFLTDRELLTSAQDETIHDEVNAEFEAALDRYEALPPPDPARQFDYTYADLPPQLQRQREVYLRPDGG